MYALLCTPVMARKNKNRRPGGGGGGEGGIGPCPSSTVLLRVPRLKEFVVGESLKRPGFVSCGESYDVKANYFKPSSYNENLYRYDVRCFSRQLCHIVRSAYRDIIAMIFNFICTVLFIGMHKSQGYLIGRQSCCHETTCDDVWAITFGWASSCI